MLHVQHVVEQDRARNLVITVRRIGMDYDFLKATIESADLTELQPEHAELLLNYIATEEEQLALEKHKHHKERLDEAERFMFEMLSTCTPPMRTSKRLQNPHAPVSIRSG